MEIDQCQVALRLAWRALTDSVACHDKRSLLFRQLVASRAQHEHLTIETRGELARIAETRMADAFEIIVARRKHDQLDAQPAGAADNGVMIRREWRRECRGDDFDTLPAHEFDRESAVEAWPQERDTAQARHESVRGIRRGHADEVRERVARGALLGFALVAAPGGQAALPPAFRGDLESLAVIGTCFVEQSIDRPAAELALRELRQLRLVVAADVAVMREVDLRLEHTLDELARRGLT